MVLARPVPSMPMRRALAFGRRSRRVRRDRWDMKKSKTTRSMGVLETLL